MNYQEVLDYLYGNLPMYQRVGKAAYRTDLNAIQKLAAALNHPEKGFKAVHVAGTNGKGSTSHIIASILQENGLKVGLYTSPHLKDFRERIKINGQLVSEEYVTEFIVKNREVFDIINPSFFEMTVAMCFSYFSDQKVDIAIIETGMGGRLDATNIIFPEVAVITNIGLDHTQFLGNTLSKIAAEKAGIIKENTPVVIGEYIPETKKVFDEVALTRNVPTYYVQPDNVSYISDLVADYQQKNIKTALQTIQVLQKLGWEIKDNTVQQGLNHVVANTNLQGRWQKLDDNPLVYCDCAHNVEGLRAVLKQMNSISYQHLHFVLGMVGDKDVDNVLAILPKNASYYFCAPQLDRALEKEQLAEKAAIFGLKGTVYNTIKQALFAARQTATKEDFVFVGGSTFVVAEII